MDEQVDSLRMPFVVPREDIPTVSEHSGLATKPLSGHRLLGRAVADSRASMAWVSVPAGATTKLQTAAEPSLLIVLQGTAELIGATQKRLERGDTVMLPPDQQYGFRDVGTGGLHALRVSFRSDRGGSPEVALSLDELLRRNEERAHRMLSHPYFTMFANGTVETDADRGCYRDQARVFCDGFQAFLFTRQAMCRDETFLATFGEHLREELGHNELMKLSGNPRVFDPVLEATSSWFAHQMIVLDNAAKAVVHLVLETGGDLFHNLAKTAFAHDDSAGYFNTHAEDDARHKSMILRLLEGHSPNTYKRLLGVLDDAWDMLDAATLRIEQLVVAAKD